MTKELAEEHPRKRRRLCRACRRFERTAQQTKNNQRKSNNASRGAREVLDASKGSPNKASRSASRGRSIRRHSARGNMRLYHRQAEELLELLNAAESPEAKIQIFGRSQPLPADGTEVRHGCRQLCASQAFIRLHRWRPHLRAINARFP